MDEWEWFYPLYRQKLAPPSPVDGKRVGAGRALGKSILLPLSVIPVVIWASLGVRSADESSSPPASWPLGWRVVMRAPRLVSSGFITLEPLRSLLWGTREPVEQSRDACMGFRDAGATRTSF